LSSKETGTGMGMRLYSLPGGDEDEIKFWYPLGLGMGMMMNCFYERMGMG